MCLYDAIEVKKNRDSEDRAYAGVNVVRDSFGNVIRMYVQKGYAGNRLLYVKDKEQEGKITKEKITIIHDIRRMTGSTTRGKADGFSSGLNVKIQTFYITISGLWRYLRHSGACGMPITKRARRCVPKTANRSMR